jgi:hypothetical protein
MVLLQPAVRTLLDHLRLEKEVDRLQGELRAAKDALKESRGQLEKVTG